MMLANLIDNQVRQLRSTGHSPRHWRSLLLALDACRAISCITASSVPSGSGNGYEGHAAACPEHGLIMLFLLAPFLVLIPMSLRLG